jgi:lysozyme family protein
MDGVDYCVFDVAVNSGPGRAIKFLQSCVGVTADGGFGPRTLDAVNEAQKDPTRLIELYSARRLEFLQSLKTFETFGRGWSRRVAEVKEKALDMVTQKP